MAQLSAAPGAKGPVPKAFAPLKAKLWPPGGGCGRQAGGRLGIGASLCACLAS